jgi:replication-associated recombination protein RarA
MNEKIPLTEKYRPTTFQDLVLPPQHNLGAAVRFIAQPSRSRWMITGKSGLGKSSLAEIMAKACAHPLATEHLVGPDLDSNKVRELSIASQTRPMFGQFYCYVCDEADAIPDGGQVRLLSALEKQDYAIWIFTSNEDAEDWEPRFLSRFTHLAFSNQKLAEPATEWICRIASLEGLILDHDAGEKIIRASKNNLRGALQHLEAMLGQQLDLLHPMMPGFIMAIPGALPVINVPMSEAKTTMPAA